MTGGKECSVCGEKCVNGDVFAQIGSFGAQTGFIQHTFGIFCFGTEGEAVVRVLTGNGAVNIFKRRNACQKGTFFGKIGKFSKASDGRFDPLPQFAGITGFVFIHIAAKE